MHRIVHALISLSLCAAGLAQTAGTLATPAPMAADELATARLTITNLGPGTRKGTTLSFAVSGAASRAGRGVRQLNLRSSGELGGPVRAASQVASNRSTDNPADGTVSLSIERADKHAAFATVLGAEPSRELLAKLRSSLVGNPVARRAVAEFGCSLAPDGPVAREVTGQVEATLGGLRLNRSTGAFSAMLSIRNKGQAPIEGPLTAAFELSGNVDLTRPRGFTCSVEPRGTPAVEVGTRLDPGASISAPVEFANPDNEPLKATIRVFSGVGSP